MDFSGTRDANAAFDVRANTLVPRPKPPERRSLACNTSVTPRRRRAALKNRPVRSVARNTSGSHSGSTVTSATSDARNPATVTPMPGCDCSLHEAPGRKTSEFTHENTLLAQTLTIPKNRFPHCRSREPVKSHRDRLTGRKRIATVIRRSGFFHTRRVGSVCEAWSGRLTSC